MTTIEQSNSLRKKPAYTSISDAMKGIIGVTSGTVVRNTTSGTIIGESQVSGETPRIVEAWASRTVLLSDEGLIGEILKSQKQQPGDTPDEIEL